MPWLGSLQPAELAFLFSIGALSFLLMSRSRRYYRRQRAHTSNSSNAQVGSAASLSRDTQKTVDAWQAELHEFAREVCGRLDSKIALLQQLLLDADQAAERLEKAMAAQAAAGADNVARAEARVNPQVEGATGREILAEKSLNNARFARIYALADRGLSASAIASELSAQIGEVELILSLRSAA